MQAVIMVGGLGTRLYPLTKDVPKPLLPVGGKPLLQSIIEHLKKHGFTHVYLATNYKAESFEQMFGDGSKFGVQIMYSLEKEPLGTAGPLKLIEAELRKKNEPFLVMNGDLFTDANFLGMMEFHKQHRADFTLGTRLMSLPLAYGVVETQGDRVTGMKEKPNIETEILAGIYIINPSMLEHMQHGKVLMTDFIHQLISEHKNVLRYKLEGLWIDIGQMTDYEHANNLAGKP